MWPVCVSGIWYSRWLCGWHWRSIAILRVLRERRTLRFCILMRRRPGTEGLMWTVARLRRLVLLMLRRKRRLGIVARGWRICVWIYRSAASTVELGVWVSRWRVLLRVRALVERGIRRGVVGLRNLRRLLRGLGVGLRVVLLLLLR